MNWHISIPFAIDLTREGSWDIVDEKRTNFFVARCHFLAVCQQSEGKAMLGEKLREFSQEPGASQIVHIAEPRSGDLFSEAALNSSLRESATLHSFVGSIAAETALAPHRLSPQAQLELTRRLSEEFQTSFKVIGSNTEDDTTQYATKITLPATFSTPLVHPAVYQRWVSHLFLTHIEYLRVHYVRSFLGLRRKRTKIPPLPTSHHDKRANVHESYLPLAAVYYWKRLPKSSVLVAADKYRLEVTNPDVFEVAPPVNKHQYHAPGPSKPSLYQLSNIAFPLKWIKRPGGGQWTEEQLRQIEEEELRGRETATGFLRVQIVHEAKAFGGTAQPGRSASLLSQVGDIEPNGSKDISAYTAPPQDGDPGDVYIIGNLQINREDGNLVSQFIKADGSTFHGDFVVAETINNSFNRIRDSKVNADLKTNLEALATAVTEMSKKLPDDAAREAAKALDVVAREATAEKADEDWFTTGANKLLRIAKGIGDVAGPVISSLSAVAKLLGFSV